MEFIIFLWATFLVGLFSFGGGKSFIPAYQELYVEKYHIIDSLKLTEAIGYATALPGPIAPMITGVIAYQKYGFIGFFIGILVQVVPMVLVFMLTWKLFKQHENKRSLVSVAKYMSPAIIALLIGVIFDTFAIYKDLKTLYYSFFIFFIATLLLLRYKISPALLIVCGGFLGYYFGVYA